MKLRELLKVLNMQIRYKVTDRNTQKEVETCTNGKPDIEAMQRRVYMVFQENDDKGAYLNISLF